MAPDAPREGDPIDLAGWQLRILDRVLVWSAALAFFACVCGVYLSWTAGLWALAALDLGAWLLIVTIAAGRGLPYGLRATILVATLFSVGVGVLIAVGPYGVAIPWLLSVPCLAAVLFDLRRFWIAQIAVLAALLGVFGLVRAGLIWQGLPVVQAWWPMAWTSLLVLSFLLGLPMAILMRGLQRSLESESARARELEAEIERRRRIEGSRASLERQLILAQRMEGVGQMAGGIAHDFNNVLTVVQLEAAVALDTVSPGTEAADAIGRLLQATRTAAALSAKLLLFSRRRSVGKQRVEVDAQIQAFEPILSRLVGETVVLSLALRAPAEAILAEPIQLEQLLTNLAANARDAMPSGGALRISTAPTLGEQGPGVRVEVEDDGIGMDSVTLSRIFEPFFTTKGEGSGTGLGLTTVYAIVRSLDGTIEVQSAPAGGARFRIHLPADRAGAAEAIAEQGPSVDLSAPGVRVVVVDDQEAVRSAVERALIQLGCEVRSAGSAALALALLEGGDPLPDLVLTDVAMPAVSGVDLAERVRERFPSVALLAMSGYVSDERLLERLLRLGIPILRKPFTPDDLRLAVAGIRSRPAGR